jgi:hypothetical protein
MSNSERGIATAIGLRATAALLSGAAAMGLVAAPAAAAKIQVAKSAPWAREARVPEKVREQCGFQTRVPQAIADRSAQVELVDGAPSRASGRALELTIGDVHAPGGGVFSGPKWGEVRGELYENGKRIGSFRAKRYTTGGVFGIFQGNCSILGRVANALGQDIAAFLESPRLDAELGDAR